jgi:hypothetical protein
VVGDFLGALGKVDPWFIPLVLLAEVIGVHGVVLARIRFLVGRGTLRCDAKFNECADGLYNNKDTPFKKFTLSRAISLGSVGPSSVSLLESFFTFSRSSLALTPSIERACPKTHGDACSSVVHLLVCRCEISFRRVQSPMRYGRVRVGAIRSGGNASHLFVDR